MRDRNILQKTDFMATVITVITEDKNGPTKITDAPGQEIKRKPAKLTRKLRIKRIINILMKLNTEN